MVHGNPPDQEGVGNEGSVTAPGQGLGAPQDDPLPPGQVHQGLQVFLKLRSQHIISIALKAGAAPVKGGGLATILIGD